MWTGIRKSVGRQWSSTAFCALALSVGAMSGCSDHPEQVSPAPVASSVSRNPTQKASLDVQVVRRGRKPVLVMTLRNTGTAPIVIDRKLVFPVSVSVTGPDGKWIVPGVGASPADTGEQEADRLIALAPGQSATRRIDFAKGVQAFGMAQIRMKDRCGTTAFQRTHAYDGKEKIATICVSYGEPDGRYLFGRRAYFRAFFDLVNADPELAANLYDCHLVQFSHLSSRGECIGNGVPYLLNSRRKPRVG